MAGLVFSTKALEHLQGDLFQDAGMVGQLVHLMDSLMDVLLSDEVVDSDRRDKGATLNLTRNLHEWRKSFVELKNIMEEDEK